MIITFYKGEPVDERFLSCYNDLMYASTHQMIDRDYLRHKLSGVECGIIIEDKGQLVAVMAAPATEGIPGVVNSAFGAKYAVTDLVSLMDVLNRALALIVFDQGTNAAQSGGRTAKRRRPRAGSVQISTDQ